MNEKTGTLGISEYDSSRYGIWLNELNTEYTLHCGDCFQIKLNGGWVWVRIEMNNHGWYLIKKSGEEIDVPFVRVPAKV